MAVCSYPSRRGKEGPVVGPHVAPQRQLTQVPDDAVMEVCCLSHIPFWSFLVLEREFEE